MEVLQGVAVLAGGDRHAGGRAVAQQAQAGEIIGGDGLLEPRHAALPREAPGEREGELALVGAVGIDEQLGFGANRSPRRRHPGGVAPRLAADLHLDPRDPSPRPAGELLLQAVDVVGREAATAVDLHAVVHLAEQGGQWQAEQARL